MGTFRSAWPLLAIAVACGGQQAGKTAKPRAADQKTFAPLSIKAEAKSPYQAVILGTDEKNGSTVVPIAAAPAKGLVDAMFVKLGGPGRASGSSSPVKLSTAPNSDGSVQVGIYEDLAGGTGAQWRAGVWMSAFVAANTLGKDLTDFTFAAASSGYIDGPSASGLMAAGFLAAITGAKIDPAATMTGTINPDGTIGPVGGIPEKFKSAIEKGKKKLGFPIGLRMSKSAATGELVDLVELAKGLGAEAVEIASVHDAYKLLTGKTLPQPVPVAEQDMALDESTERALAGKYKEWQRRLADEWSTLLQLQQGGNLPPMLIAMARRAQAGGEEAERLFVRGAPAAAYAKMLEAWVFAAAATDTFDVLAKVQRGDLREAIGVLEKLDKLDKSALELFKKVGGMRPDTMGSHMLMMSVFQSALRGWAFKRFSERDVESAKLFLAQLGRRSKDELATPRVAEQVVAKVAPAIVLIGRSFAESIQAQQRLEFESEKSINYVCSLPNVKRLSTSFQSASAAAVNYFDTLIIEPAARSGGSVDMARSRFAMSEPDYLVAYLLSHLPSLDGMPQELKKEWGEDSLAWNLMSLAANELAFFESAELIAKHYALRIRSDYFSGRSTTVEHDKAFSNMLAMAEKTARASARAARIATGAIPVQAKLVYHTASAKRDGNVDDKLAALAAYWMSSAYSQTAVMLARN